MHHFQEEPNILIRHIQSNLIHKTSVLSGRGNDPKIHHSTARLALFRLFPGRAPKLPTVRYGLIES